MTDEYYKEINFKKKKAHKEPKIVNFEEPGSKTSISSRQRRKRKADDEEIDDEFDFVSAARDVKKFGITGFRKVDQRKNQQKYAESLGAYKKKPQKVPYPLLMERIKKRKEKEERTKELERAMGVFKKKKREDKTDIREKYNLGRWVDKSNLNRFNQKSDIKVNRKEIAKLASKRK